MAEKYATRVAYGEALAEYGSKENVVVLDADLACCTMSANFRDKYPDRFFNIGIAEGNMMSIAAGIATTGKNVFASSFAMFAAGRAWEQVRNSIGYPHLNVKVVGTHSGISVGEDGATHQALEDIAIMRAIPGMLVVSPSDAIETKAAVKALMDYEGPAYLRVGRIPADIINDTPDYKFELFKGYQMREGNDITILATGLMVQESLKASDLLKEQGIHARVIDIHTIKPLDEEIILKAAKETGCIVTVEEHNIMGGLGGAVAELLSEKYPTPLVRIGMKDEFGKSGKPEELFKKFGLNADNIVTQVKKALELKK
ncbi:transketolase family protein [Anaerocolumna aminovalerica]|jgi:transketolase|uniref:Transketolase subunit B n=1 Tax=Anaerocolumna aminovalerica TaxID=1527 RepID=A0A1I5J5I4_9FIRM|nr:transketolase family protein [Anaerocolumna aminovalerica]MDU6266458.1 transketolase family protein [Anaerocolumna aminovalerica]SFO68065.1 transketolase subunit B [Anaerocolumna aminovalerica]